MSRIKIGFYDFKEYDRVSFTEVLKELKLEDQFELVYFESKLTKKTASFANGCQALCCFVNDDLSADILAQLDEMDIKLVALRCAGFDRVDLSVSRMLEISVVRVPAYSPYSVAEFACGMLLTLNRKLHRAYNRVREGNFCLSGFVGFDLHGKTVGVLGTGKIGQCFIDIAIGFGCRVLCYDLFPSDVVRSKENTQYVELDQLFAESDMISIHAPLTPDTYHLINKQALNKMKTGVIIINTSRGGLIDTRHLIDGLVAGHIAGAGLDVYENEGDYFFRDCSDQECDDEILARLCAMRNVLVTSHQAFLTREALHAIATTTMNNFVEFFVQRRRLGHLTNHVVTPEPSADLTKALSRRASMGENK